MRPVLLSLLPWSALVALAPQGEEPALAPQASKVPAVSSTSAAISALEAQADGALPATATCPAHAWPAEPFPDRRAERAQARPEAIAALEAWAFPTHTPEQEAERLGVRTDGLLILQGGEVLYERYARGHTPEGRHLIWSATKSVTSTLVGIAVREGLMRLDDSVCRFVDTSAPQNCEIRIQDLLEFASGLDWRETYENDPPTTSSVVSMLYGEGRGDMARFVLDHPRRAPPGTLWQYSSGDSTLLAAAVGRALSTRYGQDWAWTALFDPIGMQAVTWEHDGVGTVVGSSTIYTTVRDMARLGLLWMQDGCWEGQRILPAGWMAGVTQVSAPIRKGAVGREPGDTQGRQFWLNQALPEYGESTRPWPDAPPDLYAAMGHWKQGILVIPSADLIIVRVGDDRDGQSFSWNTLAALSLALGEPGRPVEAAALPPVPAATTREAEVHRYSSSLLTLGVGYGARMACSCAYVMGRDEDFCREWIRVSPDLVRVRFDPVAKRVSASALGVFRGSARLLSEREGCILEE